MINFSSLSAICDGSILVMSKDRAVTTLVTDSRKAFGGEGVVFFAISGVHHDGHKFIATAYEHGIRQFVTEQNVEVQYPDANFLRVDSSISALQKLAAFKRRQFEIPVIGVTGSNGKTIVKEWLYQLLSADRSVVKNPGSYNSQIGVPLSVWQMSEHHELGIFEAGISKPREMQKLADIIQPSIGIFTNIGSAHDEGFANLSEKISEKLLLFSKTKTVIYCHDHLQIREAISKATLTTLSWGTTEEADISIQSKNGSYLVSYKEKSGSIQMPFEDRASIENAFHCVAVLLFLGYNINQIQERINGLRSVPMRLELKEGVNQCQIIDDTYNNDLAGLQISLQFLGHQTQKQHKRVILSDLLETGLPDDVLGNRIARLLSENSIHSLVAIGPRLSQLQKFLPSETSYFNSTEDFLSKVDLSHFQSEVILVKGARVFRFERIVSILQKKLHGTVMEINLGAVVHNLNYFRSLLSPTTKIMVMVKAFAYGSGSIEIANLLQYHKVGYLGVAYADEGVELRKNHIQLPIMVMNPSEETFATVLQYNLEPEIYGFKILNALVEFLNGRQIAIHLKIDTGMHRLGFRSDEIDRAIKIILANRNIRVASIFSHLAGADESVHDQFSREQATNFKAAADRISDALGYKPLYHILNSPGILRLTDLQFDMVRLGIGLYGINPTEEKISGLELVATLKTTISQIHEVKKGETIGYGRRGVAEHDMKIATIAIGYADGFSRAFSRGVGQVMINGRTAPVVGNVCMDMTMIDVTNISASEGDSVIIFGDKMPIHDVAKRINTIPYEILTNTSERVKRVFVAESI